MQKEKHDWPALRLSAWSTLALWVIFTSVLWNDLRRLEFPVGEKGFARFDNGLHDFSAPFLGARGLLKFQNPYEGWSADTTTAPALTIDGATGKQLYPPAHLFLYVPLAYFSGGELTIAGRWWFRITFFLLFGLAAISLWLWKCVRQRRAAIEWRPRLEFGAPTTLLMVLTVILSTSNIAAFGIERGQSDVLTAVLIWLAVGLALSGRIHGAIVTALAGTALKGYGLLFLPALALFFWSSAMAIWGAAGVLTAAILWWRFPGAVWALWHRATFELLGPDNHSFFCLGAAFFPEHAWGVAKVLLVLAAVATGLVGWRTYREQRRGEHGEFVLWFSLLTSCGVLWITSAPAMSFNFNLTVALPGMLLALLNQDRLVAGSEPRLQHLVGANFLFICLALFFFPFAQPEHFPCAALGVLLFFLTVGTIASLPGRDA